jgi:hypothetical protein
MKQTIMSERTITIFALLTGLVGLLLWLLARLTANILMADSTSSILLLRTGEITALLAGLAAVILGAHALRHLQAGTMLHRRASEGFVFGVILLALTVGLYLVS